MPKIPIDYSNGLIYSIVCKTDETLIYIGSTTNLTQRKNKHKSTCNNEKTKGYNIAVYMMIRANGGWDNFDMKPIKEFPCESKIHLVIEEERIRVETNAKINTNRAYVSPEEYKEYQKEWHKANAEYVAKDTKKYREANAAKIAENKKKYYEANTAKISEDGKKHYKANKAKIAENQKKYNEVNAAKISETGKKYREANAAKIAEDKKKYYEANKTKIAERRKKNIQEKKLRMAEQNKTEK